MASHIKHTCGRLKAYKDKKQNTVSTGTSNSTAQVANTYGQVSGLDDPRYAEAVHNVGSMQFGHDPSIPFTFARQRANARNTYANPLGSFASPQLREAQLNAIDADSAQNEAQAHREDNYGVQDRQYAQAHDIATLSAPKTVQTGGSTSSTGTNSGTSNTTLKEPFDFNSIVQGGSAMGSALLM